MTAISRTPFSPENHKIIALGIPISGFSSGTYLTITPSTDIANNDVGADGEIMTNLIANNTSTVKLRVNYDNPAYQLLNAAFVAFQTTGILLPFSSVNLSNVTDTIASISANPMKFAEASYAINASDMYRDMSIFLHNTLRI